MNIKFLILILSFLFNSSVLAQNFDNGKVNLEGVKNYLSTSYPSSQNKNKTKFSPINSNNLKTSNQNQSNINKAKEKKIIEPKRVLILGIKADNLQSAMVDSLLAIITEEINKYKKYEAISKAEMMGMFNDAEDMKETLDCSDQSCLIEIAGTMGADNLIKGSIGQIKGSLNVNLQMLNTEREIVEARVNYQWKGQVSDLPDLLRVSTQSLILNRSEQKQPSVIISRAPKGATILIDNEKKGVLPEKVKKVSLGPHKLVLRLKGYEDFKGYFLAKNGETAFVDAPMKAIKKPIYETWWFWTAAVVLIGGGITTAALLKKSSDSGDSLDSLVLEIPSNQKDIDSLNNY